MNFFFFVPRSWLHFREGGSFPKRCVDLLPSPGEEDGTAEFTGARVSLAVPKSSVNSPFWGSP